MTVRRSELGPLSKLGDGAVGAVYRTSYRLPTYPNALAYKEVHTHISEKEQRQALSGMHRVTRFRQSLGARDRAILDEYAAWPLEMVMDKGQPVGCLMPLIPSDFFAQVNPPGGQPKSIPRGLEYLSATEIGNQRSGFSRSEMDAFSDRLTIVAVIAKLVYTIAFLHKHGIVYGDISLKNAVFALNPPRVMILDCDSVAELHDSKRRQANSPFFDAPEFKNRGTDSFARGDPHLQDTKTDVYKLGLCVVRSLCRGVGATQVRTIKAIEPYLDADSASCLRAALEANPAARPTAKQLYIALASFVKSKVQPPTIISFRAAPTVLPRGHDAVFLWEVAGATGAYLHGPNGFTAPVDPTWGRYTVTVDHSGFYTLEIQRRGYRVTQQSEALQVFDIPEFVLSEHLPPFPTIPSLEGVQIAAVLQSLPERPAVDIGTDFIPAIESPNIESLLGQLSALAGTEVMLEALAPGMSGELPLDSIQQAIFSATQPMVGHSSISQISEYLNDGGSIVRRTLDESSSEILRSLQDSASTSLQEACERIADEVSAKAHTLTP